MTAVSADAAATASHPRAPSASAARSAGRPSARHRARLPAGCDTLSRHAGPAHRQPGGDDHDDADPRRAHARAAAPTSTSRWPRRPTAGTRPSWPGRPARTASSWSSRWAATAPSTRPSTACSTDGPGPDGAGARRRPGRQHQRLRARPRAAQRPHRGDRPDARRAARGRGARQHRPRDRGDGRWFTFCAGLGLDADVVAAVERARAGGRRSTPALYVTHRAARVLSPATGDAPPLRLDAARTPTRSRACTWRSSRTPRRGPTWAAAPIDPSPGASFDTGLDLLGLRGLGTAVDAAARAASARSSATPAARPRRGHAPRRPGAHPVRPTGPRPFQVDGDHLGDATSVTFRSHPDALRVVV